MMRPIYALLFSMLAYPAVALDFIDIQQFPTWFQESLVKEAKIKKKTKLKIESLGVDKKILGEATLAEEGDGYLYYLIEMGTDTPAECYIFSEFDGAATSLYAILNASIEGVAEGLTKTITGKFNFSQNSGLIDSTPYLSLDLLYHLDEGEAKLSGIMKGYSAKVNDTLQICAHNEIGYRETFFTVFESFIKAIKSSSKKKPFFEIVYEMKLNGIPAGIAYEYYTRDADNDVEIVNESAILMPVDPSSMASVDSVVNAWSDPDGNLINALSYNVENSMLSFSYELTANENNWLASGESQGKALQFTLAHKGEIVSQYGSYLKASKFLAAKETEETIVMWMPEIDPSSATSIKMKKIENSKDANVEFDMGAMSMKTLLDKNGVAALVKMQQGPVQIELNTIYTKGTP